MANAGELLANRYRLGRRITPEGAGESWRASDLATGRPVALRLLATARADRFLAAAERAAQICHPGIARVHDYGRTGPDGTPFLVTELVSGASLAAVMRAAPLDPAWVLEVICQVSSALGAAHSSGLAHRDIRPGNLLLAPGGAVKITGFRLAHGAGGPGGDLYALGLVAWGCLTGQPPASDALPDGAAGREGRPLAPLPGTVPAGIAGLAADLTAVGPAARPASAADVVTRCRELMAVPMRAGRPRRASHHGSVLLLDPPGRPSRRLARIA